MHGLRFEASQTVAYNGGVSVTGDGAIDTRADGSRYSWAAVTSTVNDKLQVRFDRNVAVAGVLNGTNFLSGAGREPVIVYIKGMTQYHYLCHPSDVGTLIIGFLDWAD